jgi:hypothetical protein
MRFLLTRHGTVVHFDVWRKEFRHDGIGVAKRNVAFDGETASGELLILDGDNGQKLFGRPTAGAPLPDGRVALGYDGLGVVAGEAGQILAEPRESGARDGFWLVTAKQLDALAFIAENRWVSDRTWPEPTGPHAVRFGDGTFQVGDAGFPIAALFGPGLPLEHAIERKGFALAYQSWKLERFRLYRPLIYFAAFGAEPIFACLDVAIRSLFEFGGWDDDVLLITDGAHADFAQHFDEPVRGRLQTRVVACSDVLDYTLARYRLPRSERLDRYQPVLYLDTDVVCDAPLAPILVRLLRSEAVQLPAEQPLAINGHWYGASLLAEDGHRAQPGERGLSTGLIGFRDFAQVGEAFARIVESCEGFALRNGDRHRFDTYDQPFANYVLRKLGGFATDVLTEACVTHGHERAPAAIERRGFAHFAGVVGNAAPKLRRMQDYIAALRRERGA